MGYNVRGEDIVFQQYFSYARIQIVPDRSQRVNVYIMVRLFMYGYLLVLTRFHSPEYESYPRNRSVYTYL